MKRRYSYQKFELRRALGMSLRLWRIQRGLSQEALAKLIGTKQPAIVRWESGKVLPSLRIMEKIADAFGVKINVTFEVPTSLTLDKGGQNARDLTQNPNSAIISAR